MKIHPALRRLLSLFLAFSLLLQATALPAAQGNIWEERRRAARHKSVPDTAAAPRADNLLAQLPIAPPLNGAARVTGDPSALPGLDDKNMPLPDKLRWIADAVLPHGSVRSVLMAPRADAPLVIHVQDAHDLEDAQLNIAKMLESLGRGAAPLLVGMEGAEGAFALDAFRAHADDPTLRRQLSEQFVKEGLLGGPEHAAYAGETPPLLWGVESWPAYEDNVRAVKESLAARPALEAYLKESRLAAEALKGWGYSPALKEFDRKLAGRRAGQLNIGDFLAYLADAAGRAYAGSYPQTHLFLDALESEKSLDFRRVEEERGRLARRLAQALPEAALDALMRESLRHRAGRTGYGQYHAFLRDIAARHGVTLSGFPSLNAYVEYALTAERIDRSALLDETTALEKTVEAALTVTPVEKRLAAASRGIDLMEKLVRNACSPADWADYQRRKVDVLHLTVDLKEAAAALKKPAPPAVPAGLKDALRPFEDFCEKALARNASLVDNLLAKMKAEKRDVAVLTCGGFHTDGLVDLLKARRVSVVVVTPKIEKIPADASSYLDVFARDPLPVEKLFDGEVLNIPSPRVGMSDPGKTPGRGDRFRRDASLSHSADRLLKGETPGRENARLAALDPFLGPLAGIRARAVSAGKAFFDWRGRKIWVSPAPSAERPTRFSYGRERSWWSGIVPPSETSRSPAKRIKILIKNLTAGRWDWTETPDRAMRPWARWLVQSLTPALETSLTLRLARWDGAAARAFVRAHSPARLADERVQSLFLKGIVAAGWAGFLAVPFFAFHETWALLSPSAGSASGIALALLSAGLAALLSARPGMATGQWSFHQLNVFLPSRWRLSLPDNDDLFTHYDRLLLTPLENKTADSLDWKEIADALTAFLSMLEVDSSEKTDSFLARIQWLVVRMRDKGNAAALTSSYTLDAIKDLLRKDFFKDYYPLIRGITTAFPHGDNSIFRMYENCKHLNDRVGGDSIAALIRKSVHSPGGRDTVSMPEVADLLVNYEAFLNGAMEEADLSARHPAVPISARDRALRSSFAANAPETGSIRRIIGDLKQDLSWYSPKSLDHIRKALDLISEEPAVKNDLTLLTHFHNFLSGLKNEEHRGLPETATSLRRFLSEKIRTSPRDRLTLLRLDRLIEDVFWSGMAMNEDTVEGDYVKAAYLAKLGVQNLILDGWSGEHLRLSADLLDRPGVSYSEVRNILAEISGNLESLEKIIGAYAIPRSHDSGYWRKISENPEALLAARSTFRRNIRSLVGLEEWIEKMTMANSRRLAKGDGFAVPEDMTSTDDLLRFPPMTAQGPKPLQDTFGGKGSYLALLNDLGENVPDAFVLPPSIGRSGIHRQSHQRFAGQIHQQLDQLAARWTSRYNAVYGTADRFTFAPTREELDRGDWPLLVSVRTGAVLKMPGILTTFLNVGLSEEAVRSMADRHSLRFAYSTYYAFLRHYAEEVHHVPATILEKTKEAFLLKSDAAGLENLEGSAWVQLCAEMKKVIAADILSRGEDPSDWEQDLKDPRRQVVKAVQSALDSWENARVKSYRLLHGVSGNFNTPVLVQAMIYGNWDKTSGSGVAFLGKNGQRTRSLVGDYNPLVQGEEIVGGEILPRDVQSLEKESPKVYHALKDFLLNREKDFGVPLRVEFTYQKNKLWILQVSHEKDTPALPSQFLDVPAGVRPAGMGLGVLGGAYRGLAVFDPLKASEMSARARALGLDGAILIMKSPVARDAGIIPGAGAGALLTASGGRTSHGAEIMKNDRIPGIAGISEFRQDPETGTWFLGAESLAEGDPLSFDAHPGFGTVYRGIFPVKETPGPAQILPSKGGVLLWVARLLKMDPRVYARTTAWWLENVPALTLGVLSGLAAFALGGEFQDAFQWGNAAGWALFSAAHLAQWLSKKETAPRRLRGVYFLSSLLVAVPAALFPFLAPAFSPALQVIQTLLFSALVHAGINRWGWNKDFTPLFPALEKEKSGPDREILQPFLTLAAVDLPRRYRRVLERARKQKSSLTPAEAIHELRLEIGPAKFDATASMARLLTENLQGVRLALADKNLYRTWQEGHGRRLAREAAILALCEKLLSSPAEIPTGEDALHRWWRSLYVAAVLNGMSEDAFLKDLLQNRLPEALKGNDPAPLAALLRQSAALPPELRANFLVEFLNLVKLDKVLRGTAAGFLVDALREEPSLRDDETFKGRLFLTGEADVLMKAYLPELLRVETMKMPPAERLPKEDLLKALQSAVLPEVRLPDNGSNTEHYYRSWGRIFEVIAYGYGRLGKADAEDRKQLLLSVALSGEKDFETAARGLAAALDLEDPGEAADKVLEFTEILNRRLLRNGFYLYTGIMAQRNRFVAVLYEVQAHTQTGDRRAKVVLLRPGYDHYMVTEDTVNGTAPRGIIFLTEDETLRRLANEVLPVYSSGAAYPSKDVHSAKSLFKNELNAIGGVNPKEIAFVADALFTRSLLIEQINQREAPLPGDKEGPRKAWIAPRSMPVIMTDTQRRLLTEIQKNPQNTLDAQVILDTNEELSQNKETVVRALKPIEEAFHQSSLARRLARQRLVREKGLAEEALQWASLAAEAAVSPVPGVILALAYSRTEEAGGVELPGEAGFLRSFVNRVTHAAPDHWAESVRLPEILARHTPADIRRIARDLYVEKFSQEPPVTRAELGLSPDLPAAGGVLLGVARLLRMDPRAYARTTAWWLENIPVLGAGLLAGVAAFALGGDFITAFKWGNAAAWTLFAGAHAHQWLTGRGQSAPPAALRAYFLSSLVVAIPSILFPFLIPAPFVLGGTALFATALHAALNLISAPPLPLSRHIDAVLKTDVAFKKGGKELRKALARESDAVEDIARRLRTYSITPLLESMEDQLLKSPDQAVSLGAISLPLRDMNAFPGDFGWDGFADQFRDALMEKLRLARASAVEGDPSSGNAHSGDRVFLQDVSPHWLSVELPRIIQSVKDDFKKRAPQERRREFEERVQGLSFVTAHTEIRLPPAESSSRDPFDKKTSMKESIKKGHYALDITEKPGPEFVAYVEFRRNALERAAAFWARNGAEGSRQKASEYLEFLLDDAYRRVNERIETYKTAERARGEEWKSLSGLMDPLKEGELPVVHDATVNKMIDARANPGMHGIWDGMKAARMNALPLFNTATDRLPRPSHAAAQMERARRDLLAALDAEKDVRRAYLVYRAAVLHALELSLRDPRYEEASRFQALPEIVQALLTGRLLSLSSSFMFTGNALHDEIEALHKEIETLKEAEWKILTDNKISAADREALAAVNEARQREAYRLSVRLMELRGKIQASDARRRTRGLLAKRPLGDESALLVEDAPGDYWLIFGELNKGNAYFKQFPIDRTDSVLHKILGRMREFARRAHGAADPREDLDLLNDDIRSVAPHRFPVTEKVPRRAGLPGGETAADEKIAVPAYVREGTTAPFSTHVVMPDGRILERASLEEPWRQSWTDMGSLTRYEKDGLDATFVATGPISRKALLRDPHLLQKLFDRQDAEAARLKKEGKLTGDLPMERSIFSSAAGFFREKIVSPLKAGAFRPAVAHMELLKLAKPTPRAWRGKEITDIPALKESLRRESTLYFIGDRSYYVDNALLEKFQSFYPERKEFDRALSVFLSGHAANNPPKTDEIFIALLSGGEYLFDNHQGDGFIGVHPAALDLPLSPVNRWAVFTRGLAHELDHEAEGLLEGSALDKFEREKMKADLEFIAALPLSEEEKVGLAALLDPASPLVPVLLPRRGAPRYVEALKNGDWSETNALAALKTIFHQGYARNHGETAAADIELINTLGKMALKGYRNGNHASDKKILHHVLDTAQKTAEWGGGPEAILAALFIPMKKLKPALFQHVVAQIPHDMRSRVVEIIDAIEAIESIPFDLPQRAVEARNARMEAVAAFLHHKSMPHEILRVYWAEKLMRIDTLSSPEERKSLAKEIYQVIAPMAERLGRKREAAELRDEALRIADRERLGSLLENFKEEAGIPYDKAKELIEDVHNGLQRKLDEAGIPVDLQHRLKGLQSIGHKINEREYEGFTAAEKPIYDLMGMFIVFKDENFDHSVLNHLYKLGTVIEKKTGPHGASQNGDYTSHRVTIKLHEGPHIEFQIFTPSNFKKYMAGSAPHWLYNMQKEKGRESPRDPVRFDLTGDFERDVHAFAEATRPYSYIHILRGGKTVQVRLPKGSFAEDAAAHRDVDLLGPGYQGMRRMKKSGDKWIPMEEHPSPWMGELTSGMVLAPSHERPFSENERKQLSQRVEMGSYSPPALLRTALLLSGHAAQRFEPWTRKGAHAAKLDDRMAASRRRLDDRRAAPRKNNDRRRGNDRRSRVEKPLTRSEEELERFLQFEAEKKGFSRKEELLAWLAVLELHDLTVPLKEMKERLSKRLEVTHRLEGSGRKWTAVFRVEVAHDRPGVLDDINVLLKEKNIDFTPEKMTVSPQGRGVVLGFRIPMRGTKEDAMRKIVALERALSLIPDFNPPHVERRAFTVSLLGGESIDQKRAAFEQAFRAMDYNVRDLPVRESISGGLQRLSYRLEVPKQVRYPQKGLLLLIAAILETDPKKAEQFIQIKPGNGIPPLPALNGPSFFGEFPWEPFWGMASSLLQRRLVEVLRSFAPGSGISAKLLEIAADFERGTPGTAAAMALLTASAPLPDRLMLRIEKLLGLSPVAPGAAQRRDAHAVKDAAKVLGAENLVQVSVLSTHDARPGVMVGLPAADDHLAFTRLESGAILIHVQESVLTRWRQVARAKTWGNYFENILIAMVAHELAESRGVSHAELEEIGLTEEGLDALYEEGLPPGQIQTEILSRARLALAWGTRMSLRDARADAAVEALAPGRLRLTEWELEAREAVEGVRALKGLYGNALIQTAKVSPRPPVKLPEINLLHPFLESLRKNGGNTFEDLSFFGQGKSWSGDFDARDVRGTLAERLRHNADKFVRSPARTREEAARFLRENEPLLADLHNLGGGVFRHAAGGSDRGRHIPAKSRKHEQKLDLFWLYQVALGLVSGAGAADIRAGTAYAARRAETAPWSVSFAALDAALAQGTKLMFQIPGAMMDPRRKWTAEEHSHFRLLSSLAVKMQALPRTEVPEVHLVLEEEGLLPPFKTAYEAMEFLSRHPSALRSTDGRWASFNDSPSSGAPRHRLTVLSARSPHVSRGETGLEVDTPSFLKELGLSEQRLSVFLLGKNPGTPQRVGMIWKPAGRLVEMILVLAGNIVRYTGEWINELKNISLLKTMA